MDNLLTTKEAADKLQVSVRRVQALITAGKLPAKKFGRDFVIQESDLQLVENRQTGRPASDNPSKAALAKRRQRERTTDKNSED